MSKSLLILSSSAEKDAFAHALNDPAFATIEAWPLTSAHGRRYYAAIHGDHDASFAVCAGEEALLVCLCAPLGERLGFYGTPLRLVAREGLDETAYRAAVKATFDHLAQLAETHNAKEIMIEEQAVPNLSSLGEAALARDAEVSVSITAQVDLTAGSAAWRQALRKSFRSFINWGQRNLTIRFVNCEARGRPLFDQYQQFHAETAGRITRSQASWDVTYEWIASGGGELILGFLDGRLVAGSMFLDGTGISVYGSGVYDRALFDKPLAHYPLWLGIERTHGRGMKTLELGELPFKGAATDKEYNIGYFKRGFATHLETRLIWRWRPRSVPESSDGN